MFETLGERFAAARAAQDDVARQTLAQFSDLSERLQREVSGLDGHAAQAVEVLQQSALKVGEQSYQMMQNAQSSGAQIKDVAADEMAAGLWVVRKTCDEPVWSFSIRVRCR